jgi:hypothetical protein
MSGDWAFRLPFLLQMIPGLVVGFGIHCFPFSPRWLALRDKNQESLQALSKLRRLPTTDKTVLLEWRGILTEDRFQKQILRDQHPNTGPLMMEVKQWLDLFRPRYLKRTCVAIAIPFFQQVVISHTLFCGQPEANFILIVLWHQRFRILRSDILRRAWSRL